MDNRLITYAFLKDSFVSSHGNIIYSFKDMFESALIEQSEEMLDVDKFIKDIRRIYGVAIPNRAGHGLVNNLRDMGLINYGDETTGRCAIVRKIDRSEVGKDPLLQTTLDELLDFSEKVGYKVADLESRFFGWIKNLTFLSGGNQTNKDDDVFFSFFSKTLKELDLTKYKRLEDVICGCLIAEAVLSLSSKKNGDELNGVTFFLDSPLLLDYFDLNTKENHTYVSEVVDNIKRFGGRLGVFEHSVVEAEGVLKGVNSGLAQGPHAVTGEIGQRLRSDDRHRMRVISLTGSIRDKAKEESFYLLDAKDREKQPSFFESFSQDLEDSLVNDIGQLHHQLSSRLNDAKSIATISRLRRFNSPQKMKNASYVFVTRNSYIAKVSDKFQRRASDDRSNSIPYTFYDASLAAYMWINFGFDMEELASKKLVSSCATLLAPTSQIMSNLKDLLKQDASYYDDFIRLSSDSETASSLVFYSSIDEPTTLDEARKGLDKITARLKKEAAVELERSYEPLRKKIEVDRANRARRLEVKKSSVRSLRRKKETGRKVGAFFAFFLAFLLAASGGGASFVINNEYVALITTLSAFLLFLLKRKTVESFFSMLYLKRASKRIGFYRILHAYKESAQKSRKIK